MRHFLALSAIALALISTGQAPAALILEATKNANPTPGLESFTISARGTSGEIINSIAGLIVNGVHNVTPAFGSPSVTAGQWTGGNGAGNADWKTYDTYLLFNPSDATQVVGFIGSATETNDGSDPAGLNLSAAGQTATVGLGNYRFANSTDQITLTPAAAKNNLPFLQIVFPAGTVPSLSGRLFDTTGGSADFAFGVPEPAALTTAAIGLVGLVSARRRLM